MLTRRLIDLDIDNLHSQKQDPKKKSMTQRFVSLFKGKKDK